MGADKGARTHDKGGHVCATHDLVTLFTGLFTGSFLQMSRFAKPNQTHAGGVLLNGTPMDALVEEVIHSEVKIRALTEREFEARLPSLSRLAFRVALGVLHHREEAEDVAQDALLRAHREFGRIRDPERLEPWLVRVAWRLAIDRQRSTKRREQREAAAVKFAWPTTTEQCAESGEFEQALYAALDDLPEKLRSVMVLAGIQGYNTVETARLLGLPEGTVKSRLHSARKLLAGKLRRFGQKSE